MALKKVNTRAFLGFAIFGAVYLANPAYGRSIISEPEQPTIELNFEVLDSLRKTDEFSIYKNEPEKSEQQAKSEPSPVAIRTKAASEEVPGQVVAKVPPSLPKQKEDIVKTPKAKPQPIVIKSAKKEEKVKTPEVTEHKQVVAKKEIKKPESKPEPKQVVAVQQQPVIKPKTPSVVEKKEQPAQEQAPKVVELIEIKDEEPVTKAEVEEDRLPFVVKREATEEEVQESVAIIEKKQKEKRTLFSVFKKIPIPFVSHDEPQVKDVAVVEEDSVEDIAALPEEKMPEDSGKIYIKPVNEEDVIEPEVVAREVDEELPWKLEEEELADIDQIIEEEELSEHSQASVEESEDQKQWFASLKNALKISSLFSKSDKEKQDAKDKIIVEDLSEKAQQQAVTIEEPAMVNKQVASKEEPVQIILPNEVNDELDLAAPVPALKPQDVVKKVTPAVVKSTEKAVADIVEVAEEKEQVQPVEVAESIAENNEEEGERSPQEEVSEAAPEVEEDEIQELAQAREVKAKELKNLEEMGAEEKVNAPIETTPPQVKKEQKVAEATPTPVKDSQNSEIVQIIRNEPTRGGSGSGMILIDQTALDALASNDRKPASKESSKEKAADKKEATQVASREEGLLDKAKNANSKWLNWLSPASGKKEEDVSAEVPEQDNAASVEPEPAIDSSTQESEVAEQLAEAPTEEVAAVESPAQELDDNSPLSIIPSEELREDAAEVSETMELASLPVAEQAVEQAVNQVVKKDQPKSLPKTKLDPGVLLSIDFEEDAIDISEFDKDRLVELVQRISEDSSKRVKVVSYAEGADDQASSARRISLQRAIAIRSQLIQAGLESIRINVQAVGDKKKDNEAANSSYIYLVGDDKS